MQKQNTQLPEFKLVGLNARTNNKNEMDPSTSKIATLAGKYWSELIAAKIKHRNNPGVTYAVYTDYASDEHGDYTYFIGESVDSLEDQDLSEFQSLIIPAIHYKKFTTEPGKMPEVVITAWQEIWGIDNETLGGKRNYLADFEVYDQRAQDPNQTVVDIYIGVNS